jgi:glycosyltransferase involved in cell wall biosynthesis
MELSENLRYYYKLPFIELNKMKIGNSALAIVVPEYNRAHIIKAWWNLNNLPLLFHNKPYLNKVIDKKSFISDNNAAKIMELIGDRKIVLYQGILNNQERPLVNYVKAIEKLGNNYAFVIMSNGENIYESIKGDNYYFIPFVKPPLHLEITSHAYIGVLSYYASKQHYSDLNAVYCAPNKTFEYSMFGIPMIGNDIPGLKYVFELYKAGACVEELTVENICNAIKCIENNYELMSRGAKKYYESVDLKKDLVNIFETINQRIKNKVMSIE